MDFLIASCGDGLQAGVQADADVGGAVAVVAERDANLHLASSLEDRFQWVGGAKAPARGGCVHVEECPGLPHGL